MALLIIPIGVLLGWLIRSPKRAAAATVAVGAAALVAYLGLGLTGVEMSPLETLALVLGTPAAAVLAHTVARRRLSRRTIGK